MDESARTAIERACERLVIEYAHRTDFDTTKAVADLFTDDGVLDVGVRRLEGRAALVEAAATRDPAMRMVHVCTNVLIDVVDEDHATGVCYLTAYVEMAAGDGPLPMSQPAMVGRYHDDFVRTPSGWRFKSRVVKPVLARGA